jgi:tripartite-type tricarboxylate transporter receptor subunit TctC
MRVAQGGTMTKWTVALAVAWAMAVSPASAQTFPNKLIKIIVPFTPGGSNDVVAREIATGLQARLNQTAVVENKPGGGGTIAYAMVAKSPPDGHMLMVAPASFTMGPHLSKNPVYNPVTEFAPVNLVVDVPFLMVVPSSLPVKTLKEFIALAKSSPEKLTFGSVGVGTPQHMGAELFKMNAGIDLVHVPFRGATAAIPDLLAGRIDMFIGAVNSLLPLIQEGKLRALGITAKKRIASLPDVPTMAEAGVDGVEVSSAVGIVAPAGTPPEVIEILNREIGAIIRTPEFHQRMATIGVDVLGTSAAEYATMLKDDYAKWAKVVQAAGIKPE